jgi:hypothetical protein
VDVIEKALSKAIRHLTLRLTEELRSHALNDGWEPDIASGMTVAYKDGKFVTSVSDSHAGRAFDHEYGNMAGSPKATVRKFGNSNNAEAEAELIALMNMYLKAKK